MTLLPPDSNQLVSDSPVCIFLSAELFNNAATVDHSLSCEESRSISTKRKTTTWHSHSLQDLVCQTQKSTEAKPHLFEHSLTVTEMTCTRANYYTY